MHYLSMILVGLIAGAIAKLIMPGEERSGIVVTILLGMGGSVFAGMIGRAFGWSHDVEPAGFIASIGGAMILLALYRVSLALTPAEEQTAGGLRPRRR
jgi:uncharacterized membrane protein YeaQ/YmgE (transglycosylase-associated protein family)